MLSYADALDLARLCAKNARATQDRRVARELWQLAGEYLDRAAALDGGRRPDIGPKPDFMSKSNVVPLFQNCRKPPLVWPAA